MPTLNDYNTKLVREFVTTDHYKWQDIVWTDSLFIMLCSTVLLTTPGNSHNTRRAAKIKYHNTTLSYVNMSNIPASPLSSFQQMKARS